MKRYYWLLPAGILGFFFWLLATSNTHSADDAIDVKAAILKLAEKCEGKAAASLAEKLDGELDEVFRLFKPKVRNGIGYGPKGEAIEKKLMEMGKKAMTKDEVTRQRKDLIKMAEVTRAISLVASLMGPKDLKTGNHGSEEWDKMSGEMKDGADALLNAIKSGTPERIKKAANQVVTSCNECHGAIHAKNHER